MRSRLLIAAAPLTLTACFGDKQLPEPQGAPEDLAAQAAQEPAEPPPPPDPPPPPPPWEPLALEALPSTSILTWERLDPPAEDAPPVQPGAQLFPERYTEIPGVLTFQGDHHRSSASYGTAAVSERRLELIWTFETEPSTPRAEGATHKNWGGGAGWTGQPALVSWPTEARSAMNLLPQHVEDDGFVEVIQASLDGRVYFLDLKTGQPSRQASFHNRRSKAFDANRIEVGSPIKGSVSVDPRGWPLLYVGQGISEHGEFGFRGYSLIDGTRQLYLDGWDQAARRRWGAFDSSAVVNRDSDTLFVGGENGLIYRVLLNTSYDPTTPSLSLAPEIERVRYTVEGAQGRKRGVENSIASWKNLAWFADNGGCVVAMDTDRFEPVWAWFGPEADDTNASIAVEVEQDHPYLYLGTEIEYQARHSKKAWMHRFDGLTGEPLWSVGFDARPEAKGLNMSGGVYSTPVLGRGSLQDRVFVSVAEVGALGAGLLLALDKQTGAELWRLELEHHAWSTPVVVYDEQDHGYLILGDTAGDVTLYDAHSGEQLHRLALGYLIEASPAFMDGVLVLPVRGRHVYGIALR